MRYGIRTKLIAAFLMMLVPFAGIIILGAYDQGRIMEATRKVDTIAHEIETVLDLQVSFHKALMPPNDFIITGSMRYYNEFKEKEREVEDNIKRVEEMRIKMTHATPDVVGEEAALLKDVRKNWAEVKRVSNRIFALKGTEAKGVGMDLMEEMDYKWSYPALQKLERWHIIDMEEHRKAIVEAEEVKQYSNMTTAAGISVFAGLGILFAYFYSGFFLRPIKDMCRHSQKVSGGEFSSRLEVDTGDEFEDLGRDLNDMTERLGSVYAEMERTIEERTKELKAALENIKEDEERLAQIIEQTPFPIEICSFDDAAVQVNKAFLGMLGLESAGTVSGQRSILKDEHVKKALGLGDDLPKALAGRTVFLPEVRLDLEKIDPAYGVAKRGETVHEVTMFDILGKAGRPWGFMTLWKDISERKKNEQAFKEHIEELELFRKVTIKRELRLKELKEKIFDLNQKISELEDGRKLDKQANPHT